MKYAGIDQSLSATGFAVIDTGTGHAWTKTISPPPGLTGGLRLSWLRTALLEELRRGVDQVGMEGYAISMPGRTRSDNISQLMELGGVIKEMCANRGIPLRVVTSTQVKKWATGEGDGGRARLKSLYPNRSTSALSKDVKDCCLVAVRSDWPLVSIDNDNEADALTIAHLLTCVDDHMEATRETRFEVIKAIKCPKVKTTPKQRAQRKEKAQTRKLAADAKRASKALLQELMLVVKTNNPHWSQVKIRREATEALDKHYASSETR